MSTKEKTMFFRMEKNYDNFTMYCMACGKKHSVPVTVADPRCDDCRSKLDFEPRGRVPK